MLRARLRRRCYGTYMKIAVKERIQHADIQ
jgi:hypothetical protein